VTPRSIVVTYPDLDILGEGGTITDALIAVLTAWREEDEDGLRAVVEAGVEVEMVRYDGAQIHGDEVEYDAESRIIVGLSRGGGQIVVAYRPGVMAEG
jgi:acetyl esterase/lipase